MSAKINKEQVSKIIVGTGRVVLCGLSCLAMAAPYMENSINAVRRLIVKANYSGTIKTIMNSDMLGSYKREAVEAVQRDRDEDYYKSIIEVVKSNMLDSYKLETIKKII